MFGFLFEHPNVVEAIATTIVAAGALASLIYAGFQLRATKRSAQGGFLLRFDQMLDRYDEVHKRLRPGGCWASGRIEDHEWPDIERYMGLFERIKVLIDDGFIDLEIFDRLYGYRIDNIRINPQIKEEKLIKRAYGWKYFIELAEALDQHRRRRQGE